jgi:hypothetical protein
MQELQLPIPHAASAGSASVKLLTSASAAASAPAKVVLTSAEAKALLFRVQLAEEQRQAELAKTNKGGAKPRAPVYGGGTRKPRRPQAWSS